MSNKKPTSERLRLALEMSHMRAADLSRKTGIDKGSISSYLSGRYVPKETAIFKLANALNVSDAWLNGYDVPMERESLEQAPIQVSFQPLNQPDSNSDLSAVIERAEKEKDFKALLIKISTLKPKALRLIDALVDNLPKE